MSVLYPWKTLLYVNGDKRYPVILGKGGELSATIAFAGNDLRTSPDHELVTAAASRVNVIAEFSKEEGFFTHHDLTMAPSEYLRAPWFSGRNNAINLTINDDASPMVKLLSLKRKQRHDELVEPVIFETLSYQPPRMQLKWFKRFLFGGRQVKAAEARVQDALTEFNNKVERLAELLSSRLGSAKRLNADQLYSYCYYTLTGMWVDYSAPKASGTSFDYLMKVQRNDDVDRHTFSVRAINQNVHIRAVTMYGMPDEIRPEFFEDMSLLGNGMRWCTRLILVPPDRIRTEYTEQWKRYKSGMFSFREKMKERFGGVAEADPVQEELAIEARANVKETNGCAWGAQLVSSIIIYRTSEELVESAAMRVAEFVTSKKRQCVIEDVGTKLAFATTVPGCSEYDASKDTLTDWPTVSMLPCSLPYTGPDARGGMSTIKQGVAWQFTIRGMFPARVDFGNGQNRHVAITAPVRAGKSTLLELIISGILANMVNPFVFLMDVNVNQSASRVACRAMGGKVLSFMHGTAAIQPFRNIENPERRQTAKGWVKQCIRAHGYDDKKPSTGRHIDEAFELLARFAKEERTTENFKKFVQDEVIKQCMAPFTKGDFAAHVGGNRNIIGEPPFVVIDCTGLMSTGKEADPLAACVISALLDEITFTVGKHKGPVQLCIDEAAQVFPLISESLNAAYKGWPKQGGGITIVIHNPRDLDVIGETGAIITQNTGAWVCLKDPKAADNKAYEKHLQLTEFQTALLAEFSIGDFMIKVGGDVRVLQTDLSRLEAWVLGQGGPEALELAEMLDAMPDDYSVNLLKEGGFYDEAEWIESRIGSRAAYLSIAAE